MKFQTDDFHPTRKKKSNVCSYDFATCNEVLFLSRPPLPPAILLSERQVRKGSTDFSIITSTHSTLTTSLCVEESVCETTSIQALCSNVPVITLPGGDARSRFTYGLYEELNMMSFVAKNVTDYVHLAINTGKNKNFISKN